MILKRTKTEQIKQFSVCRKVAGEDTDTAMALWSLPNDDVAQKIDDSLQRSRQVDGMHRRRRAEMWRPLTCQWIDGDHHNPMCGLPVVPGKPFCSEHSARAYRSTARLDGEGGGAGQ